MAKNWEEALGVEDNVLHQELLAEEAEFMSGKLPDEPVSEASFQREQVIALSKQDVNMLAGLAMPEEFKYLYPKVLLAAWLLLTQTVCKTRDFSKIALGIPRGHGKTTLLKLFVLWCILFTDKRFILVISDTATKAENILADVIDMLNHPNIIRLFGNWRMGIEKDTQALYKFGFRGRNIILAAIGAGGSLRGMNLKNSRPDIMIFDDVQSKECSESLVQSDALARWLIGTAMKAKSPHGCLYIYAGNMFPGNNCILKQFKTNSSWIKFISGAILADGTALWPELHPIETLIAELDNDISMGRPEIFFSEVLNDTEAGINSKFDLSLLRPWKWTEHDLPQGKFIIIDPATGKTNHDATAIGYCEVYDETPALREIIEEVLSPGNTIRKALLLALRTGTRVIAVESTAYQSTLLYWFNHICEQLGLSGFHFVEIYGNQNSKNARIQAGLNSLMAGEIILHPQIRSVVATQIANWNPMKRDNVDGILDLIAYLMKCLELYGYLMSTQTSEAFLESNSAKVQEDNYSF